MSKQTTVLVTALVVGLLVGATAFAYVANQNKANEDRMAMEKTEAPETEDVMKDDAMQDGGAMEKHGSYVELADYDKDKSKYADTKVVYFFHASWCPTCRSIDDAIMQDASLIPAGVTLVKTDFDSETALRQKYGVTTQYTFVQVDKDGNERKQWTASNAEAVVSGIL